MGDEGVLPEVVLFAVLLLAVVMSPDVLLPGVLALTAASLLHAPAVAMHMTTPITAASL